MIQAQKIGELGEKIGTTIVKMESLGNEGKVEEAMQLSKTIEEYKKKKRDLEVISIDCNIKGLPTLLVAKHFLHNLTGNFLLYGSFYFYDLVDLIHDAE